MGSAAVAVPAQGDALGGGDGDSVRFKVPAKPTASSCVTAGGGGLLLGQMPRLSGCSNKVASKAAVCSAAAWASAAVQLPRPVVESREFMRLTRWCDGAIKSRPARPNDPDGDVTARVNARPWWEPSGDGCDPPEETIATDEFNRGCVGCWTEVRGCPGAGGEPARTRICKNHDKEEDAPVRKTQTKIIAKGTGGGGRSHVAKQRQRGPRGAFSRLAAVAAATTAAIPALGSGGGGRRPWCFRRQGSQA